MTFHCSNIQVPHALYIYPGDTSNVDEEALILFIITYFLMQLALLSNHSKLLCLFLFYFFREREREPYSYFVGTKNKRVR